MTIRAIHCPGHTPGHVVYFWEAEGIAFTEMPSSARLTAGKLSLYSTQRTTQVRHELRMRIARCSVWAMPFMVER